MSTPRYTPVVRDLPALVPFVGPEALTRVRGRRFRARLGANESLFGPSPHAIRAMQQAATESWKYADPESYELRAAIARLHGVTPASVVIGEGIDGLLGLTVRMVVEPGSTVVTSEGAYPTFNFHVAAQGGRLVKVPYRSDREDLEALLDAARRESARILYVSNPDNPMGSWWRAADITRLVERLPDGTLLILDEAYCDTAPADAVPPIDVTDRRVLRYRTFSKAYGLAGARIGYCLGDAGVIAVFDKLRNHYGINLAGQMGALAAVEDQDYLRQAVAHIARARERIAGIATANGLTPLPSATNFVAIDCRQDGAHAKRVLDGLLARDVFARMPGVAPLNRCIRVSCGREEELALLEAALPAAVTEALSLRSSG